MTLRAGIVGAGDIAPHYVATLLPHPDSVSLVGVYDRNPDRARSLADKFGGRVFASVEDLLSARDIDVVVLLTRPDSHASLARRAMASGKHVYTEKPLALNFTEAQGLMSEAVVRGVRLAAAPVSFLGAAQQTALRLMGCGEIGAVQLVYAEMNHAPVELWHPRPEPFYDTGPLRDLGPYPLSLMCLALGPVREVRGFAATLRPNRRRLGGESFVIAGPDFVSALVSFASGATGRLTTQWVSKQTIQTGIEFHGERGSLVLRDGNIRASSSILIGRDLDEQLTPLAPDSEPYTDEFVDWGAGIRDLADAIQKDRPHRASAELASHVVEVMEAIQASAAAGVARPVTSGVGSPGVMATCPGPVPTN